MSKTLEKQEKPEYTGRYLVLLPEGSNTSDAISQISSISGLSLKSSLEFENEFFTDQDLSKTDGIVLDKLGIAIVNEKPKMENAIAGFGENEMIVEKERVVYAIGMVDESTQNYVEGYRDAINHMTSALVGPELEEFDYEDQQAEVESVGATWGLKATNVVPTSILRYNPYNGTGIKVAILDTGLDCNHPDFADRDITHKSFISGESTQDGHGHGTHCTGTACGPLSSPAAAERYGIAYAAKIFIGKVLNNGGSGGDGGILAGINWAIANRCEVVSMSLRGLHNGTGYSAVFETAAARALAQGTLIIAAAGNDSSRPGTVRQVMHPANCPSIMAVGAIDVNMRIASFSNGGLYPTYGAVDIAAPGVNVYSSTKLPTKYASWNGTSMATPHVAGIAALWAQASGLRGINLWKKLTSTAKALSLPARDVGAGLVQAPAKNRFGPFEGFPILRNPKFPIDPITPIEK
ncbi:S8 family peptidase [Pedobacter endophyticus]|uniref:S8 family serine peptidase n=1 Tax=Pedobacter endophyticus TaxID=2789740 RepID=A0A7S9Q044_9SPHI|nr:S8 family serine peptidase [Pedobacter endophyticus]QPH41003.1 S8 family serine peptidase [Pedobacter endophyticus]